jgi:hypothetical protein
VLGNIYAATEAARSELAGYADNKALGLIAFQALILGTWLTHEIV